MIRITNLSKSYLKNDVKAVKNLDLTVNNGELFGFLGPNGAGKTTTIRMMAGLLKPDAGEILYDGISMQTRPLEAKALIGYVPDEPVLYEKMTGWKFCSFIADMFNVPAGNREKILRLAETFELSTALNNTIASYSHGMKQKICLVAALAHDPQILLLDEPMVGLDPKAAFHIKELLKMHCRAGSIVFFSTHIMEVAERLCDRVGIICKGELLAAETVAGLQELAGKKNATLEQLFLEMTDGKK